MRSQAGKPEPKKQMQMVNQISGDECNVTVDWDSNVNTTVMQLSESRTQNHSTEDNYAPVNLVECSMDDLVSYRENRGPEDSCSNSLNDSNMFDNIKIGDLDLGQLDDLIVQGEMDLLQTPSKIPKPDGDSSLQIDRLSSSMLNRNMKETFMMQERKSLAIEQERMNDIVKTFKASIHSDLNNNTDNINEIDNDKKCKSERKAAASPDAHLSVETTSQIAMPPNKTIGDCELLYDLMGGIDE